MKRLLFLFLLFSAVARAQVDEKAIQDGMKKLDTMNAQLNESISHNMHVTDSINAARFAEQNIRNLDAFMAQRREQEKKDVQRMYWRLGFGGLMLVVLVVGMVRKRKAAANVK